MLNSIEIDYILPEISERNEIQKYPFGIWVPLDLINSGGLIEYLVNSEVFQDYFIKNSQLGPLLDIIRKKLGLNVRQFSLLIGINSAHYSATIKNEKGIKFQKFLDLYNLCQENTHQISNFLTEILLSKKTSLYKTGSKLKLNFHPDGLLKIKYFNKDYVILPTSKWETKKVWNNVTSWIKKFSEKNKRGPTHRELKEEFGGGFYHNFKKYELTHNDLLKIFELSPNEEKLYDWSNPKTREIPKLWASNFFWLTYIFNQRARSPKLREMKTHFPGFFKYLDRMKITYNSLLKSWNLQLTDIERINREGLLFDKIGKKCLNILFKNVIKEPRIYYTENKRNSFNYVKPDGVVHNFITTPLKKIKNSIFLKNKQRVHMIVEFKRTFGSMKSKDWYIYSNLANKMEIFLLIGKSKSYFINNCKISFHPLKSLISSLRKSVIKKDKSKIEFLIKQLQKIT